MNEKEKQLEDAYNLVKDKANSFSEKELEKVIVFEGYDKGIAKNVIKRINDEKTKAQKDNKEKILSEISSTLKDKKPTEELKAPKKNKGNIFTAIGLFFKKIYFFFENIYYSIVDAIDKVIPIGKLVDAIDKVFPSFLLSIIFLVVLIWLLFSIFSGIGQATVLEVNITDTLNMPISGATTILSIADSNTTLQTGTFGDVLFENFNYKKKPIKLIIQKEAYLPQVKEIKLKRGNNSINVKLEIDTTQQLYLLEEKNRNLLFKENDLLLATRPLNVTLRCVNSGKTPEPSTAIVNTGQLTVKQVMGCGDIRIDVSSDYYNSIQNQLVAEDNTIRLTAIASNYGSLDVTVRNQNTQQPISNVLLQLYRPDDITTVVNESNILVMSGTTTSYGNYVFTNLAPGNYTIATGIVGYVSTNRHGPYNVVVNNTTTASISLNTGNKNLIILLADANGNTTRELKGDITLYKKTTDRNLITSIGTRDDVNRAVFTLEDTTNARYRISVINTEEYGYYAPDILDVNYLSDTNTTITIPIEYSTELNSGKIGVNVKRNGYNISNSHVYLYRNGEDEIPYSGPITTNNSGDCNFNNLRVGKRYYAYAIKGSEQGISETKRLDVNRFLRLNVDLEEQAKVLNLKVTPTVDYNISFYKMNGDEIEEYIVTNTSSDANKAYVFNEETNNIFAVIEAEGKATYQTTQITLIPGQIVYKAVALVNTKMVEYSSIELMGIYDESGTLDRNIINLAEDLDRTLKLKFKLTTTKKDTRDTAYAYIRAGKSVSLPSDYIRLENVLTFDTENEYGCNFSGELTSWDENYFNNHYQTDHSQANCQASPNGFKWVLIDFSDSKAEQIEFFVDFRFQNGITNPADYVIYYKSLTEVEEEYDFDPNINASWENCDIRPDGFFYSLYKNKALNFSNSGYAFAYNVYDYNVTTNATGQKLSKVGNNYILNIGKNYKYTQKLLYLDNDNINNEDINASSVNTLGNLIYKSYKFRLINHLNQQLLGIDLQNNNVNSTSYIISNQDIVNGTEVDHNSVMFISNFFTTNSNISTNLFNISDLDPFTLPVQSYNSDSNVFIEIIVNNTINDPNLYAGDNNISFRVRNNYGSPIPGVIVTAQIMGYTPNPINFGTTDNNGLTNTTPWPLPILATGYKVKFRFGFPVSYGLPNNQVIIMKTITSGYKLYLDNNTEITPNNPITYSVGRYTNNGVPIITKDEKSYFIKRTSYVFGNLQNVDLYPNPSEHIDFDDVNAYVYSSTNNNIPTLLNTPSKQINTRIALTNLPELEDSGNTDPNQTSEDPKGQTGNTQSSTIQESYISIFGGYHNIINLGYYNNTSIRLDINAPLKTNILFDVNLNTSVVGVPHPGIKESGEELQIELIKSKSSTVDFNYYIENKTINNLPVDINFIIDSVLNDYITINSTREINILPNHGASVLIRFDLNNSKNISSPIKDKLVNINFTYTVNDVEFTETLVAKVSLYDLNHIYLIDQPFIQPMSCSSSNCDQNVSISITNKTRTYDLILSNLIFSNPDTNLTIQNRNPPLPMEINSGETDNTKSLILTVRGNYSQLQNNNHDYIQVIQRDINKILQYNLNIKNVNNSSFSKTIQTTFRLSILLQSLQDLLEENGLYSNMCLGVGGINVNGNNNFYILGNCENDTFNDCASGTEAKPRILYDWSSSGGTNYWSTICIENTEADYNEAKTHCDSAQMLFSIFSLIKISNNGNFGNNKYIYLMSDGVSTDLLSDYINNNEFLGAIPIDWSNRNNVLSDNNINNGNFSIERIEINNAGQDVNTKKPGKYRIILNENFRKTESSPLNIKLELVREMPYNMRNLLYYMPIDGKLGLVGPETNKRSARNGYGTSISVQSTDNNLPITISSSNPNDIYLYKSEDNNISRTIINLQNNESNLNSLRSEGKLIDMTLTEIDEDDTFNISVNYSPTYPIPIYSKVVDGNIVGLSYKLKIVQSNTIPINTSNFLIWKDYLEEEKVLADGQYYSGNGVYIKSMVDGSKFNSVYDTSEPKLLKTTMYWPMLKDKEDRLNMHLLLKDGSDNLGNNPKSKLYTLRNIDNNGSTDSGAFDNLSRINYNSQIDLGDLFETYVMDGDACIRGGLTVTTIRWVDQNIGFTDSQIAQIIADYNSVPDTGNDAEVIIVN